MHMKSNLKTESYFAKIYKISFLILTTFQKLN